MYPIVDVKNSREVFDKLNDYYGNQFGINPEFSQIRIEETLVNGQGVYSFDVKKERQGVTEQSLRRNDLFVVTSFGFYFMMENSSKPGVSELASYVKKGTAASGDTAAVQGFTTKDASAFYNGKLFVQTGTIVNIEDMPLSVFKKISEYQAGAEQEFNLLESQVTLAERLVFAGTQDHAVKVTFPSFTSADYSSVVTGETSKLVFLALGYKVPSGTGDKFRNSENPFYKMI